MLNFIKNESNRLDLTQEEYISFIKFIIFNHLENFYSCNSLTLLNIYNNSVSGKCLPFSFLCLTSKDIYNFIKSI